MVGVNSSSSRVGLGRVMGCLLGRLLKVMMRMLIKLKSRNRRPIIPGISNSNNKQPPNNRNHPQTPTTPTTTLTQIKNTNQNKTQPPTSNQQLPLSLPITTTNPRNKKLIRILRIRIKLYWMIMIFHQSVDIYYFPPHNRYIYITDNIKKYICITHPTKIPTPP